MEFLIEESKKSGGKSNIENSASHIYSHLMKIVSVKNKSGSWVKTVFEQYEQLIEITNETFWRDVKKDPIRLERIKRKAIHEYIKDGNLNANVWYNFVDNEFNHDIREFQNLEKLRDFMINHAGNDDTFIDFVNKQYNKYEMETRKYRKNYH